MESSTFVFNCQLLYSVSLLCVIGLMGMVPEL